MMYARAGPNACFIDLSAAEESGASPKSEYSPGQVYI